MNTIQKERDEGLTLTHWRKSSEDKVPEGMGKKIRGGPGESGGQINSGEGRRLRRRLGAELGLGEGWLLCLSLASPTQPLRGRSRPGQIIRPHLGRIVRHPSDFSIKNSFRPEHPCKSPRWCIEDLWARIYGSRREIRLGFRATN